MEVIFPFLFLVCYNSNVPWSGITDVIFPFLFLVCYNLLALDEFKPISHISLFILGML